VTLSYFCCSHFVYQYTGGRSNITASPVRKSCWLQGMQNVFLHHHVEVIRGECVAATRAPKSLEDHAEAAVRTRRHQVLSPRPEPTRLAQLSRLAVG
jgi:hypothetical protein